MAGISAYAFLIISNRVLGDDRAAPLGAIWAMVFTAGPGFFLPLEQEVSRAVAHRFAQGEGAGPLVRRAALAGAVLTAAVVTFVAITSPWITSHLFEGQWLLLASLIIGIIGYFFGHLARGMLSGQGAFGPYSVYIGGEAAFRLVICVLMAIVGVKTAGGYGLAIAIAPFIATAVVIRAARPVADAPGPPAPWSELGTSMGALLAGSVLSQGLTNAGILAANALAGDENKADAKRFFNGVIVARLPLFLFQAVQAALLPKLAALAGAKRYHEFRHQLTKLVQAVAAIGILGTVAGFLIGPFVLDLLFAAELGHRDLGLLAGGTAFFIVAMSLAQALIAVEAPGRMAFGWLCGVFAFLIGLTLSSDLHLRVELASVLGSAVPMVVMLFGLAARLRSLEQAEDRLAVTGSDPAGPTR